MTTLDRYLHFSIHDLKRLGMLRDGFSGSVSWMENGKQISSIGLYVRLDERDPAILLHYKLKHTEDTIMNWIHLHYQHSNLPNCQKGYWMFLCPFTGKPCRVLYLHAMHFKSRKALPPGNLYKSQTESGYFKYISRVFNYEDTSKELLGRLQKPYGKMYYRGHPTRTAKRLMAKDERLSRALRLWLLHQRRSQ